MLRCSLTLRPTLTCPIPHQLSSRRCLFHAGTPSQAAAESISIPCHSNGNITLDVHHPIIASRTSFQNTDVAIYLPRGPLLANSEHDESNLSVLRSTLSCPVVSINYRCSREHQFPTATHDVALGVEWVVSNLLPKRTFPRPGRSEHVGRLVACGELVGGQLASSLSLTECRLGEPGVVAAAVSNPIVNWVDLGSQVDPSNGAAAPVQLTTEDLLRQRDSLFRRPEHYFDPFASPILFFRSAGTDVPPEPSRHLDDMEELIALERDDFFRQQLALSAVSDWEEATTKALEGQATKKRKASRRFPSNALGLRLPPFHISAGTGSVLHGQAVEFAHLLRQSFERRGKLRATSRNGPSQEASDLVRSEDHPGLGSWGASDAGRMRMKTAARWLASVLEALKE